MKMKKFKGSKLKEKRKELKLTQKQVADKIGKSLITVIRIEKGIRKPDSNTLMKLAKIFSCECEDFFE